MFLHQSPFFFSHTIKSLCIGFKAGNTARLLADHFDVVQYEITITYNEASSL